MAWQIEKCNSRATVDIRDFSTSELDMSEQARREAQQASKPLRNLFEDMLLERAMKRDQRTGVRVDRRKYARVVAAGLRGSPDIAAETKPYIGRKTQFKNIHIGVVAGFSWYESHKDPQLLNKLARLTLAVSWACEKVGANVTAMLTMKSVAKPSWQMNTVIKSPARRTRPDLYTHLIGNERSRNFGGHEHYTQQGLCPSIIDDQHMLEWVYGRARKHYPTNASYSTHLRNLNRGGLLLSGNGGNGVKELRDLFAPNIVIGIGSLTDMRDADVRLTERWQVESAIASIVEQVKALDLR